MRLPMRLFHRRLDAHKRDFGHVFILAGSTRFIGAACLCAQSAMRSGAGMVTLGVPKSLHAVFAAKLTEAMTLPLVDTKNGSLAEVALKDIKSFSKGVDVLLIGPGLSQDLSTQRLIRSVVKNLPIPMIIDADGLNALAGHCGILKNNDCVLTPHMKEFSRLTGISVEAVKQNRKKVAKDFALRYNSTLVLKGCETIVASPREGCVVNKTGNPGMATAGSGDVLSGMIAAFMGQGLKGYEAARFAVYLHGLAGDLAAEAKTEISLIASDIIEYLPKAFKQLSKK